MAERDPVLDNAQDRTSERRTAPPRAVDSTREGADEDFLFHLYRGSELLQDNRVHEAQEALESALTLQPRDAKGQDLLAVVYFRIGHYPRAIQIYEQLRSYSPNDPALKLNLALCYLKTGQAQAARQELEELVRANPAHKRAWGYLGLAYERVNEFVRAEEAFARGGHTQMARRMGDRQKMRASVTADGAPMSLRQLEESAGVTQMREALSVAFEELDAGDLNFSLAAQAEPTDGPQSWRAIELGAVSGPTSTRPLGAEAPPASLRGVQPIEAPIPISRTVHPRSPTLAAPDTLPGVAPPPEPLDVISARPARDHALPGILKLAHDVRLLFPDAPGVYPHPSGVALVRVAEMVAGGPSHSFATRLEAVRSLSGALSTAILERQTRGKTSGEAFGGVGSPLVRVSGAGQLVLAPRPSHTLIAFRISEDAYVREDVLLGFELSLSFENGRLGEGDAAPVVHLRGTGTVLLELMGPLSSLEVTKDRGISLRREAVLGWIGRLTPRTLSPDEAPCGHRGMIGFHGDGTVLIAAS